MPKNASRYTIKVLIYEIEPLIWRRFSVPGSLSFAELHSVLQQAMGWENRQAHEFRYGKGKNLTDVIANPADDVVIEGKFDDETKLRIDQFFKHRRVPQRMLYRYDFTEDWVHELTFEAKEESDDIKVQLLDGERACPPEDCGGPWGYMDALNGNLEWIDDDYDPGAFDFKRVQLKL